MIEVLVKATILAGVFGLLGMVFAALYFFYCEYFK